ncbi:ribonuclease H2 subunit B isoform X1 [Polypterus senegalus]|uniref:ribonuclease H2 subunit B isoform X1 n=1 Tax=Polypterus senegalus TaxID=55291 RepID=UPI001962C97A|nr:ribonuclease H2 subunit B isoform X1 [Polypterus senegalus]
MPPLSSKKRDRIGKESAINVPKRTSNEPIFLSLRHPKTDNVSLYLLSNEASEVFEVKAFNERYHSWFIGQSVQHDGRLLFLTRMDPVFLLLPYFSKFGKEGKFQPVEQVVVDEAFPGCIQLLKCSQTLQCLSHVTEKKEVGSQLFYRYNKDKTLTWLKKKVDNTVKALKNSNICVGDAVKSSTFIRSKRTTDIREEDYLRYAHGLVSEYISEDLSKDLLKYLQLPELSNATELEPPSKKRKLSDNPVEAGEDYTKFNNDDHKKKPTKKMTPAQKALAKVDKTGMKTLSAFFSPKSKI